MAVALPLLMGVGSLASGEFHWREVLINCGGADHGLLAGLHQGAGLTIPLWPALWPPDRERNMELLNNLILGFGVAFTFQNLLYALGGAVLGTLIGVLPGLGPVATIAMLLPSIYALDATPALIMLAGIYYGAQYGGSTTAILINVPGERSVVTAIDGYQMARKGRAGAALAAAGLGSFFAGSVATLIVAAFAPPLTELAFKFGPAEYFSLMVVGLIGAVVLASGSLVKAIAMILLGLLLGQINTDVISGVPRYSFDIPELTDGIGFVAIAMGVFGFGEIISNLGRPDEQREVFTKDVKGLWPTGRTSRTPFRPCCAAPRWAPSWACCPAAARCWPRLPPTRWKRRPRPAR
jgi:TctA family transporter